MSERYEVEVVHSGGETRQSYRDLETAMANFYISVGQNVGNEYHEVHLHDLISSETLASWKFDPDDEDLEIHYHHDPKKLER